MGYCALLIPQDAISEKSNVGGFAQKVGGKLMSGLKSGGLSFSNATSVLKDTASLISEGVDTVANKFSGIALTQLLTQGKITSETALGYLTQGFPQALGMSSVAMGFQSVEQLKTALKSKNGVNVQQFIKSFQNFGKALSDVASFNNTKRNIEGYQVIEIDAVTDDDRDYSAETPDRRVESGQLFNEFAHNMPDIFTLNCVLQEGRNYTSDDFEGILLDVRKRKVPIDIILGDDTRKTFIITNFHPKRTATSGLRYSLELKHIAVGSVSLVSLSGGALSAIKNITENALNPKDTKTGATKSLGLQKSKPATEALKNDLKNLFSL